MIASSLTEREVAEYAPTPPDPGPRDAERGAREGAVAGPALYTVDASGAEGWTFFDFSRGSVVERPAPGEWDLAFQRFRIIANGGDGFAGRAGALDLGERPLADVRSVPDSGYVPTVVRSDSTNEALSDWYDYRMMSHLLEPKDRSYAVRTADGRYAVLRFLGYYCPGARPGCVTFEYVYPVDAERARAVR